MPYVWSKFVTGSTELFFTLLDAKYDIGNGDSPAPSTPLPNGEFDELGPDRAPRRAQTVRIDEWYVDEDRATAIKAWKAVHRTKGQLWRTDEETGAPEWTTARLKVIPIQRGIDNAMQQDISLSFILYDPIWKGVNHGTGWYFNAFPLNYLNAGLNFNEIADQAPLTQNATTAYVLDNDGSEQVDDVIVTITAGDTAITSVHVVNTALGIDFTWAGTLAVGKKLILDMGRQSVTNDSIGAYSGITRNVGYTVDAPLAFPIPAGGTTYQITLVGGGAFPPASISATYAEGVA